MDADKASNKEIRHTPRGLSNLPSHWEWALLESVCLGIYDCPHSTPKLSTSGPLMARTQDILSGIFMKDGAVRVSEETYQKRIRRAEPRHGDLLYSREGTYFGIAAEVPDNLKVCLGQRMVLLRPDSIQLNHRFLRYWLNSPFMSSYIHGFRDGSVAERLNMSTIRALPTLIPPLREQKAIAHVLGTLDDKIELNRRMNATLDAMARAIFKSWFVDFDPVRAKMDGRSPSGMDAETAALFPDSFDDSELGKIPKGWRIGRLSEYFNLTMGQSPPSTVFNEIGEGMPFYQGRRDFGFRFPAKRVYCTETKRLAEKGDTLVSVRAPVGAVNMALEKCCIGRGVAAVRHLSNERSYTYYTLLSLQEELAGYEAEGTVFGSITRRDFESLAVVHPTIKLIEEFENRTSPMDSLIEKNHHQLLTMTTLRDTLLPKLLSGEIRVDEIEPDLDQITKSPPDIETLTS